MIFFEQNFVHPTLQGASYACTSHPGRRLTVFGLPWAMHLLGLQPVA